MATNSVATVKNVCFMAERRQSLFAAKVVDVSGELIEDDGDSAIYLLTRTYFEACCPDANS